MRPAGGSDLGSDLGDKGVAFRRLAGQVLPGLLDLGLQGGQAVGAHLVRFGMGKRTASGFEVGAQAAGLAQLVGGRQDRDGEEGRRRETPLRRAAPTAETRDGRCLDRRCLGQPFHPPLQALGGLHPRATGRAVEEVLLEARGLRGRQAAGHVVLGDVLGVDRPVVHGNAEPRLGSPISWVRDRRRS